MSGESAAAFQPQTESLECQSRRACLSSHNAEAFSKAVIPERRADWPARGAISQTEENKSLIFYSTGVSKMKAS